MATFQVTAGNRDGYQLASGLFGNISGSLIQVGNNSNPVVAAVGFAGVTIPQGAAINSAVLILTGGGTYNAGAAVIQAVIYGEDVDDSPVLTTANGNISGRSNTTANTATGSLASVVLNQEYNFDVTAIVAGLANRDNWISGNAMTFLLRDSGSSASEWQEFHAYDGDSSRAAKLVIDYGGSGGIEETVDQTQEVDSSQGIARLKQRPAGLVAGNDLAQGVGRAKAGVIGQEQEVDSSQGIGRLKQRLAGLVTGSDLAQGITAHKGVGVGMVGDVGFGQGASGLKQRMVGAVGEGDAAQAVSHQGVIVVEVGLVSEVSQAQGVGRFKRRVLGLVGDEGEARPQLVSRTYLVDGVVEVGTAGGMGGLKWRVMGLVGEMDVAAALQQDGVIVAIYMAALRANGRPAARLAGNLSPVAGLRSNPSPERELLSG